jgi:hypothetical protein
MRHQPTRRFRKPQAHEQDGAGQTQANGTLRIGGPGRFPPFEADFPD